MITMRFKSAFLVGMLCLLASAASAGITRVAPASFTPSGEDYLTIFGNDLLGTAGTVIVFDGLYTVAEPNYASPTEILVWVPGPVLALEGQHSVVVQSIDAAGVRVHGPAFFTVALPPSSGPPSIFVPEAGIVAEAQNVSGAIVDYQIFASSANGADLPVSCAPASGSQFPVGLTRVQCSATDSGGTAVETFAVFVTDTTPPVVTVPGDIESETPVITFAASAVDNIDGTLPVTCTPASGSSFAVGRTTVRCLAVDLFNNTGGGTFTVYITKGPPQLLLPSDIGAHASGPAGAVVTYEATAEGGGVVGCAPASGSTFPIATTVVTCTVTNPQGTATGTFNVTVGDYLPPVLSVPSQIAAQTTSPTGAVVVWVATAIDVVDGDRLVVCAPASGSLFPLGTTTVFCSSSDTRGNASEASFDVSVVLRQDNTPPVLTLPATVRVAATSASGAVVNYAASALDAVDGIVPIQCTPPSGSVFAIGTTRVNCTASDTSGNAAIGSFDVIVEDKTPPVLTLPAGIRVEATSPSGAVVPYTASALDAIDGVVPITCTPASGAQFAIGSTPVSCTASDTRGNRATGSFSVTVEDTTPPEIVSISASPNTLWPPNHQMVNVVLTVVAVDTADSAPASRIVSVSSNQPVNGTGDGDTAPDWSITGPLTLQLRAERAGSAERIYSIVVESTDASGNRTSAIITIRVAGSKSRAVR